MDPTHILNWQRIDRRVTTSGQPSEAECAEIVALGVRHVINLGLHSHPNALPDEAATLTALGVTYVHQPVDFQNPTLEDFRRFCAVMAEMEATPVHVHCIMNYRVSAFMCRYQRDVLGMDEALARAKMEQIWQPDGVWAAFVADRRV
jgi:uncharacterized protein (TIGR01244 family)